LFVILSLPSYAEDDVSSPNNAFLRSEIGMHTAAIKSIDVDAEERYLVTGSLDKTVRVWSLTDSSSPVQILRPPIGKGREGEIHAVAISRDGETIAAGGWTGQSYDNTYSVYLFDRQSGEMTKCISGHPNLIFHLTYSPDGRYLVANLAQGGIRVYRTTDYHLQAQDTDYGDASYWADFDSQGRLVTSSWDGLLRLYDKDFKLLTKNSAPGGSQPVAVDFSPIDDKIAVGFADSSNVSILSGKDLSPITDLVTEYEP
jgi:WD40 repeat protein